MGYLDELKRKAEEERARNAVDLSALDRNAYLADTAGHTASRYLGTLVQQLNVLKPIARFVLKLDQNTEFRNLRMEEFRSDTRRKKLRYKDVIEYASLAFEMKSGRRVTMAKDFPPAIEKLEAKLVQCGAPYQSQMIRENGKFVEKRFEVVGNFRGSVHVIPDHDTAWVQFRIVNIDGFGTTTVHFPATEVGAARLDELARWITGEPNRFLDGGQGLLRTEA